jgi:D-glycero-alpha-D-manno-heptose-7-phosphate kinase
MNFLKYSKIEQVKDINEIQHPIIREALKMLKFEPQVEITTLADIPAGTGLGSSGSFTTALLKALYTFLGRNLSQRELSELACHIEIDLLREPIGKQDQYISTIGGLTCFTFHKKNESEDKVTFKPLNIKKKLCWILKIIYYYFSLDFREVPATFLKIKIKKR